MEKLINNTYWDGDYGHPSKIDKLVCKKATSSSSTLMTNLLVLALVLFLF